MSWNRQLWGVEFTGSLDDPKMLLGNRWHNPRIGNNYDGEPTRALLFNTREQARAWCRARRKEYKDRNDCCKKWIFTPVKVQELVAIVR